MIFGENKMSLRITLDSIWYHDILKEKGKRKGVYLVLWINYRVIPLNFTLCWVGIITLQHDIWISFVSWKKSKMQRWFLFVVETNWKINVSQNHIKNEKRAILTLSIRLFSFLLSHCFCHLTLWERFCLLSVASYGQTAGKALSTFLLKNQQWQSFLSSLSMSPKQNHLIQIKCLLMFRCLENIH